MTPPTDRSCTPATDALYGPSTASSDYAMRIKPIRTRSRSDELTLPVYRGWRSGHTLCPRATLAAHPFHIDRPLPPPHTDRTANPSHGRSTGM
eukprot:2442535-Prymnesium_polylepis.1